MFQRFTGHSYIHFCELPGTPFNAFILKPSLSERLFGSLPSSSLRRSPFSLAFGSPEKSDKDRTGPLAEEGPVCMVYIAQQRLLHSSTSQSRENETRQASWLPEPSRGVGVGGQAWRGPAPSQGPSAGSPGSLPFCFLPARPLKTTTLTRNPR